MSDWPASPHGPLRQLAPSLWEVTGSLGRSPLPRNMAVARLSDGGLLVHSAVCLDDAGMAAVDALGPVRVIVVPNPLHRADGGRWKARYPDAIVVCPEAARSRVEEQIPVDDTAERALPPLGVAVRAIDGIKPVERAIDIDCGAGRAWLFCDALFHFPQHVPGLGGLSLRLLGSTGFFGITRIGRWSLLDDRAAYAAWLRAAAADPPAVICVAHGEAIVGDCRAALLAAAARLA